MIYTVGHSTHAAAAFLELLRAHDVRQVADVRRFPHSRRQRQFDRDTLDGFLGPNGIAYRHFPALGGRRRPESESINTAWREEGFRGYADYMASDGFVAGIESLIQFAGFGPTAVMCAEALWWRCHRRLLADALLVREIPVFHILPSGVVCSHEVSEFARVEGVSLSYPGLL